MSHQVFIERCRDNNPGTAETLAQAVAERYQIDAGQILARLRSGRFRVKANLTVDAAREFVRYLESQGALCSIVSDNGEVIARSPSLNSTMLGRPSPVSDLAVLTPSPPTDTTTPAASMQVGALEISNLDGRASAIPRSSSGKLADRDDVEAFLPPDALKQVKIELDNSKLPPLPPLSTLAPAPELEEEKEEPAAPAPRLWSRCLRFVVTSAKGQFALGLCLSFFVGYFTSSTVAAGMEDGQYHKAKIELKAAYVSVDSVEAWGRLDELRVATITSLERRRRNIVVSSLLIWLAMSSLLLFLWKRFVDWDRVCDLLSIETEFV